MDPDCGCSFPHYPSDRTKYVADTELKRALQGSFDDLSRGESRVEGAKERRREKVAISTEKGNDRLVAGCSGFR